MAVTAHMIARTVEILVKIQDDSKRNPDWPHHCRRGGAESFQVDEVELSRCSKASLTSFATVPGAFETVIGFASRSVSQRSLSSGCPVRHSPHSTDLHVSVIDADLEVR